MATSENVERGGGPSISPSSSQSGRQSRKPEPELDMDFHGATLLDDVPNIWDWGDLLSFADQNDSDPSDPGRIRKRDPKMSCSNFLAGRVPCACPELDEMMMMESEEEGSGHGKKKKARTVRAPPGVYRCQVPACGVDIKELKGYHRRHRVCLQCANASTVNIHGETKRYCQQCGKFHILPDFDEGKRSCRRKLEHHNNRRRRKSSNSKSAVGKESQGHIQREDVIDDDQAGEENLENCCQIVEKEALNESEEGPVSPLYVIPKDVQVDGIASLVAPSSDEIRLDGINCKPIDSSIPSYFEKSARSSTCQTGRISFKLYDWNPAEFPRRLRHQIFEWLSSMPVELEGYIRPGCTILTVFVAMPNFMWMKLFEDPITHLHHFVVAPGGMLSGKGNILVYINNMSFHVVKGHTSMIKPKVKVRLPRLHYVHPTCFEAGKPMEFIVCGSNLLQAKFRFLVSFSGKYLSHHCLLASSQFQTEGATSSGSDQQIYRIRVPLSEADICGPVFIEVENEAGLSNFLAVLVADKAACSEMKIIQQRIEGSMFSEGSPLSSTAPLSACDVFSQRKTVFPEAILDIAWLLKKPGSENLQQIMTAAQIQRFSSLLNYLITMESTIILEKILQNMKIMMNKMELNGASSVTNADLRLLEKYMDYAYDLLRKNPLRTWPNNFVPRDSISERCFQKDLQSDALFCIQDLERNSTVGMMEASTSNNGSVTVPLLKAEAGSKPNFFTKESGRKLLGCTISGRTLYSRSNGAYLCFRPVLYAITIVTVCLGICAVFFHPQVGEFATSVRRCLLG